jgi:hypothetical protein
MGDLNALLLNLVAEYPRHGDNLDGHILTMRPPGPEIAHTVRFIMVEFSFKLKVSLRQAVDLVLLLLLLLR